MQRRFHRGLLGLAACAGVLALSISAAALPQSNPT
jgi:hypothetical protein